MEIKRMKNVVLILFILFMPCLAAAQLETTINSSTQFTDYETMGSGLVSCILTEQSALPRAKSKWDAGMGCGDVLKK